MPTCTEFLPCDSQIKHFLNIAVKMLGNASWELHCIAVLGNLRLLSQPVLFELTTTESTESLTSRLGLVCFFADITINVDKSLDTRFIHTITNTCSHDNMQAWRKWKHSMTSLWSLRCMKQKLQMNTKTIKHVLKSSCCINKVNTADGALQTKSEKTIRKQLAGQMCWCYNLDYYFFSFLK